MEGDLWPVLISTHPAWAVSGTLSQPYHTSFCGLAYPVVLNVNRLSAPRTFCSWGFSIVAQRNPRPLCSSLASAVSRAPDPEKVQLMIIHENGTKRCDSLSPGAEPLVPAQDTSSQVKREEALCARGQRGLEERAIPTESITGE